MNFLKSVLVLMVMFFNSQVFAETKSVDFVEPKNGEVLVSPFKVKFAVEGMEVLPAGNKVLNSGHHHLIINAEDIVEGQVIPADEQHLHFGKGQKEVELALPPGHYKLTLQFADGQHKSYGQQMSKTIEITVK
jgi:hypothetical protein